MEITDWNIPGMRDLRPVFGCDEDGWEADREVAPLQTRAALPPPALDTEREGGEAALALEVNTQTLEALSLLHHGQQPLAPEPRTALTGVGYEVEDGETQLSSLSVAAGTEPNTEAEDKDDQDTDGH